MNHVKTDWLPKNDNEMNDVIKQSLTVLPVLNNEEGLRNKALLLKALGDETRLRIIGILKVQDSCLCELVSGLVIPASTLTHHLQILERGGVIQSRKEKKFTIFSIVHDKNLDLYISQNS
ncbi:ArsR/SmtB family transcription factor [Paenibacillus tianjinensis]|uniref:Winged helix-turn-helix transcriptional regulator n=1 Tax=Paenibacillus tianjinensis TaxID=2810347 RepID=A0ABX7L737_9BACL|nr:metalloregulator ArsR/SmtB family transcription factor [Paenibacillus tianjinensis]QSF42449.1 winged helix-turn-helix transcriptional regulator [Paenibacillus tianjinensis]